MASQQTRVIVCAVIKDQEGRFLLLKRLKDSRFAPGEWEFVSGTIDKNETAEQCVTREVKEETGLALEGLRPLEVFDLVDGDGRWLVIPYDVELEIGDVTISSEHSSFKWANRSQLRRLSYMQNMKRLWK